MIGLYIKDLNIKGGTHKQFLYFLNYLEARNKTFKVITSELDYNKTYEGFARYQNNIICIPKKPERSLIKKLYSAFDYINLVLKELKDVQVFNVHNLGLELYFPFLRKKNIVWQVNDLPDAFRVGIHKDQAVSTHNRFLQQYLRWSVRSGVKAIAVNVTKNKERIREIFGRDADVFYCGIETIPVQRDINLSLNRLQAKKVKLLSSGVFFPYRNYESLIEVVRIMQSKGYEVSLDIIGSTELDKIYTATIRDMIKHFGLENIIVIHGQVDENTFRKLHADADLFLFVNVDQSWGLAVFEAMSCGLPVIVSQSVGATELLHDGKDAIFVNPQNAEEIADKIEWLSKDEDSYRNLSDQGISFCKLYSWDNAYSKHMYALLEKNE